MSEGRYSQLRESRNAQREELGLEGEIVLLNYTEKRIVEVSFWESITEGVS